MAELNQNLSQLKELNPVDQQILWILCSQKVILHPILDYLLRYMKVWQVDALEAVFETHLATESQVADALAMSLKLPRIFHLNLQSLNGEPGSYKGYYLPYKTARRLKMLLISGEGEREGHRDSLTVDPNIPIDDTIELVCANPCASKDIAELSAKLGTKPKIAVAEGREILKAIDYLYPLSEQLPWVFSSH